MAADSFLIATLSDVIRSLNAKGADYALAGGLAYSAWVEPRATTDVDLVILLDRPSPEKLAALFPSVFESLIPHPAPMKLKSVSVWRVAGVRQGKDFILDLLLADSEFLGQALARKQTITFHGLALPIITLEDLILLKAIAGRLQDLADLERIRERSDLQVDWDYVRMWQVKLGIVAV